MVDFRFSAAAEAFRAEVRAFLAGALSPDAVAGHDDPTDLTGLGEDVERRLHRAAGERGWLRLGLEGDWERRAVFDHEVAYADAPLVDTAVTLAGQALAAFGSGWQLDLLERMAAGEVTACIAYSEEGAGSDLTAVEATATPVGATDGSGATEASGPSGAPGSAPLPEGWVLRGTKVLVTGAHKADWCLTIARTRPDEPARRALSMFVVDMRAPGVEVVRRPTMNGWTLGDVVFHDVRLGPEALLGTLHGGWKQLVAAVAAERTGMFWIGFARHALDLLVEHVRTAERDGRPLADDPLARDTVGRLALDLEAGDRLARRALWSQAQADAPGPTPPQPAAGAGGAVPGGDDAGGGGPVHSGRGVPAPALAAMAKVVATELLQDIAQAATELAGPAGLAWAPPFAPPDAVPPGAAAGGRLAWEYLERVHGTISVGANELQRDTIAQLGLGLPRGG